MGTENRYNAVAGSFVSKTEGGRSGEGSLFSRSGRNSEISRFQAMYYILIFLSQF